VKSEKMRSSVNEVYLHLWSAFSEGEMKKNPVFEDGVQWVKSEKMPKEVLGFPLDYWLKE